MLEARPFRGPTPTMYYPNYSGDDLSRSLDEKLELLQQLSDDPAHWLDEDPYDASESDATASSFTLPLDEELNADACEACVYDPTLFPPSSPLRGSLSVGILPLVCDREKPLPLTPTFLEYRPPPPPPTVSSCYSPSSSPPSTPLSPTFSSSASSSPCIPYTPPRSCFPLNAPRPRPKSSRMSISSERSTLTHSTFPSISSTLSYLEERETEVAKRSAVYVTDIERDAEQSPEAAAVYNPVLTHVPVRKSSKELLKLQSFMSTADSDTSNSGSTTSTESVRTTLTLSTSHSSPQLRALADLASTPASPVRTMNASPATSQPPTRHHTLTRSYTFPADDDLASSTAPLSPTTMASLSSRWSLDSTHSGRPVLSTVAEHAPESPAKLRKRDRLMSFISRNRAGSVGKSGQPNPAADAEYADLVGFQPDFFGVSSPRNSKISAQPSSSSLNLPMQTPTDGGEAVPPLPIAISVSGSSSSSTSTLPTPIDSSSINSNDVLPRTSFFASEATFASETTSYLPDLDDGEYELDTDVPPQPTLPLPSPSVPTTSFLVPQQRQSTFPFLSTFRRKNRRHKKLVISNIPYFPTLATAAEEESVGRTVSKKQFAEKEQKERFDAIVKWCESFGALRRVERRSDGSVHIHWKEWEAADMVCRIQGQVHITGVGTVSLAWHYLK